MKYKSLFMAIFTVLGFLALGTFGLKVFAVDPMDSATLATPALISPADGAAFGTDELPQTADWGNVSGVTGFVIEICTENPGNSECPQDKTVVDEYRTTSIYANGINPLLPQGVYWWHVMAVNYITTEYSEWSDVWKFTIDDTAPDVEITFPSNEGVLQGVVNVRGTVVEDSALQYRALMKDINDNLIADTGWVDKSSGFTDEVVLTVDTTGLPDDIDYTIELMAMDNAGNTDEGSKASVTVYVYNVPDDKNACKKYGWQNFTNPVFKNQGDCVSYFILQSKEK